MKKKIILSAGGTGGHLFPAQSLAAALPEYDICFVAGGLADNRYFDRHAFSFQEIETATFSFSNLIQVMRGCPKILSGIWQANNILTNFRPHAVVGFGSFFTLPLLIAAAFRNIPIILHEQNTIPGKVNRLFAPIARAIAITFPSTRDYLGRRAKKKAVEVLFPMRKREAVLKQEAWDYFGLSPRAGYPTLLIFGGSQGAVQINALFLNVLQLIPPVQILHFTGHDRAADEIQTNYNALGLKAYVKAFEPRIDLAMQIADCAIVRAGAATICELIEYELPALLIPHPFATENHQEKNGEHFVSTIKGGKMYKEKRLDAPLFARLISQMLIEASLMRAHISAYKLKHRAQPLCELIREILS